jgi:hypothetical protein
MTAQHPVRLVFRAASMVVLATLALTALALLAPAHAQWVEPRFDPPVGSRWLVKMEETTEETKERTVTTGTTATRELTILARTADGFQVSYVTRDIVMTGTAPEVALMQPLLGVFRDLKVIATLDASGKPVRVDNLAEVAGAVRRLVDGVVETFKANPQAAAAIRRLTGSLVTDDPARAAELDLEQLPQLAIGQNTGLKPGVPRTTRDAMPSLFGGTPVSAITTLTLVSAQGSKARYVRTQSYPPESIRQMISDMLKQMGGLPNMPTAELEKLMKQMAMVSTERLELDVEGGMTRAMKREDEFRIEMMGRVMSKRTLGRVTVAPAP